VELGVIGEAPLVRGLAAQPWLEDELVLIVPRRHALARRRPVRPQAVAGEPYIVREEGSSTRAVAERYLAERGVVVTPAMELGSTEAIWEAVAAGLGLAVVSRHAVRARDPRVVVVRFAGPRWTRELLIVWRERAPLSPAAERFRAFLQGMRGGSGVRG
jgi:DNA-binding transcriptional LysR family regulator